MTSHTLGCAAFAPAAESVYELARKILEDFEDGMLAVGGEFGYEGIDSDGDLERVSEEIGIAKVHTDAGIIRSALDAGEKTERERDHLRGHGPLPDDSWQGELDSALQRAEKAEADLKRLQLEAEHQVVNLKTRVGELASERNALEAEQKRCLDILQPAMRESGLEDACRQVKQVAILGSAAAQEMEARIMELEGALAAERRRTTPCP